MTKRQLNKLIKGYNGYNKTDSDFVTMIRTINDSKMSLVDGKIEYSADMTTKHYSYRVVTDTYDNEGYIHEGNTVGYFTAYKCFINGLDNNYEILAYIS